MRHHESVFKSNMDVVNYQPLYDMYNDYLSLIIDNGLKEEKLEIKDI